jgi:hypothetical protein
LTIDTPRIHHGIATMKETIDEQILGGDTRARAEIGGAHIESQDGAAESMF